MTFFYESDQSVLGRIAANQASAAYRQSVPTDGGWVDLLNQYYDAYPQMDASVALGLAKAGVAVNSTTAQQIGAQSVVQKHSHGLFDGLGDVLSPVAKVIGKGLSPIAHVVGEGIQKADETLMPTVRGATRTAFVALESGLQEVQDFSRAYIKAEADTWKDIKSPTDVLQALPIPGTKLAKNFETDAPFAGTSSGQQSIKDLIAGNKVDLGTGFLPGGQVEEQVKQQANQLTLKVGNVQLGGPGHPSITPGRVAAAFVSEPGTKPFNIISGLSDAAAAWTLDPAATIGKAAKEAGALPRVGRAISAGRDERSLGAAVDELRQIPTFAKNVGHAEGLLPGVRNTVDTAATDGWGFTPASRRVAERIAATDDFSALREATKKKLPVDMLVKLTDATTPQEVIDIIHPAIGKELDTAPEFVGFKAARANRVGFRIAAQMPSSFLDPTDLDQAVTHLDRWMRGAKIPPEIRNPALEKIARNPGREAMVATMDSIMGDVAEHLTNLDRPIGSAPISAQRARSLTTLWSKSVEDAKKYFVDEIASNRKAAGVKVDGVAHEVMSPFLPSEYLDSVIPLPEPREIRRATSNLATLVDNPFWERTVGGLDNVQNAWKRLTVMRGATAVRILGETQIGMSAAGYDSMFLHPIHFIAGMVGADSRLAKLLGAGTLHQSDILGRGFYNDVGEAASTQLKSVLHEGWAGWAGDEIFDRGYTIFGKDDPGYGRAWAQAVGNAYSDPVLRQVAESGATDAKKWWWSGAGSDLRKGLVTDRPELATLDGANRYIDTAEEGLRYRTGNDPILMDAVGTGKINGENLGQRTGGGKWNLNPALEEHMGTIAGPEAVKGQVLRYASDKAKVWDNVTSFMFSHLLTEPTNKLVASPVFRQAYYNRLEEMIPFMDDATRAQALRGAEGQVTKEQFARMAGADSAADRTITDLASADTLAKTHSIDVTKKLMHDLTNKGQFADTMRLISPFAEPWKQAITRWARIGMDNPNIARRGQQIITGARGAGFFHKDANGQEVFTYPFSRHLTKTITGIPFDINGRVSGLSLMTEVLPGVGPVVQIPAAALLPETPEYNWVRDIISPYGEQDYSNGILESFAPGYARNILQFFKKGDPRLFANTVGATGDYLASTGDYDLTTPTGVKAWVDESKSLARKVYLLRGLVQFGAPTAPIPEFLVKVKKGAAKQGAADVAAGTFTRGKASNDGLELANAHVVLQDYYNMQKDPTQGGVGYDQAPGEFLNRYGIGVLTMLRGKSISIPPKLPVTKASAEWAKTHSGVVGDYGLTWGLFAPQGGDDFDYVEYARQFKLGDKGREMLTPEQRLSLAQASVGRYLYAQAQAQVSAKPTKYEREWLASKKAEYQDRFPGYKALAPATPGGANKDQVIAELMRAVNDKRLAGTQLAKVAKFYMEQRNKALAYAQSLGVKTLDAAAASSARDWLGQVGAALTKRYPEFQEMFDTVFSREVT